MMVKKIGDTEIFIFLMLSSPQTLVSEERGGELLETKKESFRDGPLFSFKSGLLSVTHDGEPRCHR